MRLNIGMRGLNPNRSRKVLMLEDGIPIALAPYGEPDMYYSPPIERMSRVEVLKGSGQIAHGPQTVGGLVNFVTPEPPSKFHGDVDIEGGQRGLFVGQASMGGSNRDQSVGWITNYLHKQGDGWRQFYYDIEDVQTKFSLRPNDRHAISLKAGVYDEVSNSTYLGLTTPMYEANPDQNPVPSDTLDVERISGSLSHSYTISPNAVLSSTAFLYGTKRFWGRQDFDRSDKGREYLGIAGDPSVAGGAIFLRNSAGNRNRLFNVYGAQTNYGLKHAHGNLDVGIRYIYEKAHDRRVNGNHFNSRTGTIRDDEFRYGRALAGYVQNRFAIGSRVTLTPGVRFVHYSQERHITRKRVSGDPTNVDIRKDNEVTTAIPGLGFSVRAHDEVTFFTGVHRGFAPPGTKIAITSSGQNLDLDSELSWNYEAGIRLAGQRAVSGEFTFFRMDFSNQIITAAESGGATTTVTNGGATLHQGFESSLKVHWNRVADITGWSPLHRRAAHVPADSRVHGQRTLRRQQAAVCSEANVRRDFRREAVRGLQLPARPERRCGTVRRQPRNARSVAGRDRRADPEVPAREPCDRVRDPARAVDVRALLHDQERFRRDLHLVESAPRDPAGPVPAGERRLAHQLLDSRLAAGPRSKERSPCTGGTLLAQAPWPALSDPPRN